MSLKIKLKNEQISSFLRTDDALQALNTSVDNGQIRLSLQILVEVIEDLLNKIDSLTEKLNTKEINKAASEKTVVKQKVEEPKVDLQDKE